MTTALTEYRVCLCGKPIRSEGRGWVHLDGFYRCGLGPYEGTGWAEPFDSASLEYEKQQAYEDGMAEATRWSDEEKDDAYDEGYSEGFQRGDSAGYHRCKEHALAVVRSVCPEHLDEFERLS